MTTTLIRGRAAVLATTATLAAAVGLIAAPQAPAPLTVGSARITIAGTSNIHAYTASTSAVRLTRVQLGSVTPSASFWDDVQKPGGITAFEIAIPAATLTSPKDGLDKNMHKALRAQEHADITFRLVRLEPAAAGRVTAVGVLRIAGVEREITMALQTVRHESGLTVKGDVPLLMTDFGIKPPTAMLGMLKTDPKVTVSFEALLAVPLT